MRRMFSSLIFVLVSSFLVSVCLSSDDGPSKPQGSCQLRINTDPKYGYDPEGQSGPSHWGDKPEYRTCKRGSKQSPIDIQPNLVIRPLRSGPKPAVIKAAMKLSPSNDNWGINCENGKCGQTTFKGTVYKVVNIHFHSPSEHYLNGKQYDLESHIVHKSARGKYLVISTMFERPNKDLLFNIVHSRTKKHYGANPLINQCLANVLGGKSSFKVSLPFIMNPTAGFCTYTGSLTTPPCTEGVQWVLQLGVQPISEEQIHKYRVSAGTGLRGNNRPLQKRNKRDIVCYSN